jgi:hypothetical protein
MVNESVSVIVNVLTKRKKKGIRAVKDKCRRKVISSITV